MAGSLLMGRQEMTDLTVSVQFVIDIQDRTARITEDGINSLLFQAFNQDL